MKKCTATEFESRSHDTLNRSMESYVYKYIARRKHCSVNRIKDRGEIIGAQDTFTYGVHLIEPMRREKLL